MDLAADQRHVALTKLDPGSPGADIWIIDTERNSDPRRPTLDPADDINPVWSHDGSRVAFTTFRNGNADIYVKNASRSAAGVAHPAGPFWSPDGREIAYVAEGKLWRVNADGGAPQPICDVQDFRGGTWNREGTILFGSTTGLFRVPAEGGSKPTAISKLEAGEAGHTWPLFLPDGRRFLYLSTATDVAARALFAGSLDSNEHTRIGPMESNVGHAEPGWLVFRRDASLYAQRFDADGLRLTGDPMRLADAIPASAGGRAGFSVSTDGTIVCYRDTTDAGIASASAQAGPDGRRRPTNCGSTRSATSSIPQPPPWRPNSSDRSSQCDGRRPARRSSTTRRNLSYASSRRG